MLPTPRNLLEDVLRCWADYTEEALPPRRRLAFCTLRVGQRTAYYLGWVAGDPRLARLIRQPNSRWKRKNEQG